MSAVPAPRTAPALVEMRGIIKRYGGVQALAGADFTVYPGEIHALVGDNAAGKSSLIKALSGAAPADAGEIRVDGRAVAIRDPRQAKALGIETVYQDLALADNLDIPANIFLGRELMHRGLMAPFMDLRRMREEAGRLLGRLKIRIPDLNQKVRTLSGGQRQCVGIARAVYFNARLIILDEPTAALGVEETRKVLELVREMRDQGLSVVMISHNLAHVFDLCERITVMKTGIDAGSRPIAEITKDQVMRLIVMGREAALES
jgi:D-xylose transport system ATP-binding protein